MGSPLPRAGAALAFALAVALSREAWALQPLRLFVEQARTFNNDNRRALATREQRDAEASVALGRVLPSIDVRGLVARTQLEAQLGGAPGQAAPSIPQDIWLVSAGITIPVSVGAWERNAAAHASARAAASGERAVGLDVERAVTRAYYELVGAEAVIRAANHGLTLATENAATVQALAREGEASVLDTERARADVARAEQDVADAEGNVLRARRQLRSATGVEPEPASSVPTDDLHDEGPLASWTNSPLESRPAVTQAASTREAAGKSLAAARADWAPTLSASAQEIYTNATESLGRKDFYAVYGLATWHVDLALGPNVRAQHAALDVARAAEAQARIDAQDAVYYAWVQVRTDVQKARSARVQEEAAGRTAALARERFAAGEATQIDVLQAQQTYIQAEVARIRVESDLIYARAALRLSVADGGAGARR